MFPFLFARPAKPLGVLISALVFASAGSAPALAQPQRADAFVAGADCSHVAYFESQGGVYRDGGVAKDPFAILKEHGVNCVRLRVYTSSTAQAKADPYNAINNLDYTVPLARRVKAAGLKLLIDFHYSDTWADPGHQAAPAAWRDLPFDKLEQQMYAYNRDAIAALKRAGAMPDYVQVGNETPGGLLWPMGKVGGSTDSPEQWSQLGRLMNAAVRGIEKSSGAKRPKIIVHLDRGGDWGTTKWFFDHLLEQHVKFDIIGESYYPYWQGSLENLRACLNGAAARYQKPVVIAETDFPWNPQDEFAKDSAKLAGIPASQQGQVQFVETLGKVLREVPGGRGAGIYWWAAEYLPLTGVRLGGFEGRSFFDAGGNALPVIDAMGKLARTSR
ncbi:hypothetical protein CCAX7_32250 [Capsulimonas corticalis]|uniref:Arabinogalactan endo-beta-1,4-galactanase n=1 Tax=Capsulimonas corticalis TaxID=2219043 RepID=A0A402D478_9BACT|nr:glycosyl hydrolase 53 family protein [Capsulimonas corticalis]BDI31174.1 hypothetical protein CCAX7_32250 [Capsulimonas corticalis]